MVTTEALTPSLLELPAEDELSYVERAYHHQKIGNKILSSLLLASNIALGGYILPIALEEQRLSDTQPRLIEVMAEPNHLAAETVIAGGFNVRNSVPNAEALAPLSTIGAIEALEQDNTGISHEAIAREIIKNVKESGRTEVGLWGTSVSGITLAAVARIIQEDPSNIRVRFLMLDCTPPNVDSLRADKRQSLANLQTADSLLPNLTKHPAFEYFYADQRMKQTPALAGKHFGIGDVLQQIYDPDAISSVLASAEALEVVSPSIASDLKAIGNVKNKRPPIILSIRPLSDTGDNVVNSTKAEHSIDQMAQDAGLTHVTFKLDGISHGDPTANRTQYQEALIQRILPVVEAYDHSIKSRLYTIDRPG